MNTKLQNIIATESTVTKKIQHFEMMLAHKNAQLAIINKAKAANPEQRNRLLADWAMLNQNFSIKRLDRELETCADASFKQAECLLHVLISDLELSIKYNTKIKNKPDSTVTLRNVLFLMQDFAKDFGFENHRYLLADFSAWLKLALTGDSGEHEKREKLTESLLKIANKNK